jgi:hypothetical protein
LLPYLKHPVTDDIQECVSFRDIEALYRCDAMSDAPKGREMATGRILTKELDARLTSVEERIEELVARIGLLDEQARQFGHAQWAAEQANAAHLSNDNGHANGNGSAHHDGQSSGKMAELEAIVSRLDERVEKIASTIVAARWS